MISKVFIFSAVIICSSISLVLCHELSHDHHGHSHDHHGHSHDHHGHSHDHHGYSHDHEHSHDHHDHSHQEPPSFKYSKMANDHSTSSKPKIDIPREIDKKGEDYNIWLTAIGSTILISLAPVVMLYFVPLDNSKAHENRLKTLLSFASGGLLGDAFLHLIPHALSTHNEHDEHNHAHSHSHSHDEPHSHNMSIGLWILAGIVTFLAVEKLVRLAKGGAGHGHSHTSTKKDEQHGDNYSKKGKAKIVDEKSVESKNEDIKVSAYLNLAADFAHNFTDGLAIGASYLVSRKVGIMTTVTILIHEVPHEIGDYAILLQSGCSKKKAILLQLTTAVGALAGTMFSLIAEGAGDFATSRILPFTAGGFIYIATVSIIPELLRETKIGQSLKEIFAMLIGIAFMVMIGYWE